MSKICVYLIINTWFNYIWMSQLHVCAHAQVTKLCPTLWLHGLYSPPDSSVHGISQAKTLKWVAISFSRESSWLRDWTCTGRWILYCSWGCLLTASLTREAKGIWSTQSLYINIFHSFLVPYSDTQFSPFVPSTKQHWQSWPSRLPPLILFPCFFWFLPPFPCSSFFISSSPASLCHLQDLLCHLPFLNLQEQRVYGSPEPAGVWCGRLLGTPPLLWGRRAGWHQPKCMLK